ncbi:DUF6998 domain-containing protein [Enterococcus sp. RIT-PI-f]|uniref:DUF6998 domain-containing protein n=1 Tax=Enterococcus sp. RIT-PI-f TaxID=1690244 RepID=UPI0006B90B05|nr:hypothetical protein [Enterococcus sp. RIT-PI-f]KPG70642.1 hypothetical protein AEQ18_08780 [Enterococcus sp. RIT-PI-f]
MGKHTNEIETKSNEELLMLYSEILTELNHRKVVRTYNSPVGDYAEWLVCNTLGLQMANNSNKGFDAIDPKCGLRFQIKSRWVRGPLNKICLSPIRAKDADDFDILLVILFDASFGVQHVYQMESKLVMEYGKWRKHLNGYILRMSFGLRSDSRVEEITETFRSNLRYDSSLTDMSLS